MLQIQEIGTISQRIIQLVDHFCQGNKTAFGRAADIQSGVLAGIVGGRESKPGFEILQKLLTAYPSVNAEWLLFGRGQMLQESTSETLLGHPIYPTLSEQIVDLARSAVAGQIAAMRPNREAVYKAFNEQLALSRAEDVIGLEEEAEEVRNRINEFGDVAQTPEVYELANRLEAIERAIYIIQNIRFNPDELAPSLSYRIDGKKDYAKPFDGLLSRRLKISEDEARQLVLGGGIGSIEIEGFGHEISEYMVRKYLEKKKQASS